MYVQLSEDMYVQVSEDMCVQQLSEDICVQLSEDLYEQAQVLHFSDMCLELSSMYTLKKVTGRLRMGRLNRFACRCCWVN